MSKPRRLRFSSYDDVVLLRQVVNLNPYENGWKEVREAVVQSTGKDFNARCLREHVQHLLKLHNKEDYNNLRKRKVLAEPCGKTGSRDGSGNSIENENVTEEFVKPNLSSQRQGTISSRSGTEEEYHKKEELIQQLKTMLEDMGMNYSRKGVQESIKEGTETKEGAFLFIPNDCVKVSREASLEVVENSEDSVQATSKQSRRIGINLSTSGSRRFHRPRPPRGNHLYFALLKEKQNREAEHDRELLSLKKQKLKLEQEKLQLEREKFELERKERESRLEMERREQDQRIIREKRQQDIIDLLLTLVKKEAAM